MIDPTSIQTRVQQAQTDGSTGFGKMGIGILSGFLSTFLMNQASLHGVDFTLAGVPSEVVKSGLDGALVGFFVMLTPQHFVAWTVDTVLFFKNWWKQLRNAANQGE